MKQTVVIAIGGNAITKNGQKGTVEEQIQNIRDCCDPILDLVQAGYHIVLTHGNGPQVGSIMIQNEVAQDVIPVNPLDVCGAQTQGSLGYMISQELYNRMKERSIEKEVTTIVTRVIVDRNDANFQHPTKPVGPFYTREEAEQLANDANEGQRSMKYEMSVANTDENMQVIVSVDGNKGDYDEITYLSNVAANYENAVNAEINRTPFYATIAGVQYTAMQIKTGQGDILYCVRKNGSDMITFIISYPDGADDKIGNVMNAFQPY